MKTCPSCIKADVCSKKIAFETMEHNIMSAVDPTGGLVIIDIGCKSFSQKTPTPRTMPTNSKDSFGAGYRANGYN